MTEIGVLDGTVKLAWRLMTFGRLTCMRQGIVRLVAMENPKLYTSLSIDQILTDLIQAGGKTSRSEIHKLTSFYLK